MVYGLWFYQIYLPAIDTLVTGMSVTAVFLHAPRKVEVCCQVKDGGSEAKKERLYKLAQLLVLPPVLRLLPQQLQLKALTLWPGLK